MSRSFVVRAYVLKNGVQLSRKLLACGVIFLVNFLASAASAADDGTEVIDPRLRRIHQRAAMDEAHHLRAILEITTALGLATVWYLLDERNVFDWDRPAMKDRLNGKAWRFDNNTFPINYVAHPLNGAGMYALARANSIGVWGSFGYSFLGSTFWEYVIEFQEKVSINDMIITPAVGLSVGEFAHKLAWLVNSAPKDSWQRRTVGWTLGLGVAAHRAMDRESPPPSLARSSLGLSAHMAHEFQVNYGFGLVEARSRKTEATHVLRLAGELISLHNYGAGEPNRWSPLIAKAADFSTWFGAAEFSSLKLMLGTSSRGIGSEFLATTLVAGYHAQGGSQPTGAWINTSAISVAYFFRASESFGWNDRQGLLLGPGLTQRGRAFFPGGHADLQVSVAPAFGSLSGMAYGTWQGDHPEARTKTVLERHGYFYAGGGQASLAVELAYGPFSAEFEGQLGRYGSIEGLDRSQEEVNDDAHLRERTSEFRFEFGVRPTDGPFKMTFSQESRTRRSKMQSRTEMAREQSRSGVRTLFSVGSEF